MGRERKQKYLDVEFSDKEISRLHNGFKIDKKINGVFCSLGPRKKTREQVEIARLKKEIETLKCELKIADEKEPELFKGDSNGS